MPSSISGHSHRATTKVGHKPFKAGKGRHRKGKVADERPRTPQQHALSKLARRNQNRQRLLEKQKEHRLEASIFAGRDGAPRNVAVIPLCRDCDAVAAVRALNESVGAAVDVTTVSPLASLLRTPVDRFKQQLQYILVGSDRNDAIDGGDADADVWASLDAARAADFVVFVLSAAEEVDERGELILRAISSQGMSTLFTVVQGLEAVEPAKQRPAVLDSLRSFMGHFHPDQDRLFRLDSTQDCAHLMRSLCSASPKGIHWRDERSWLLVEEIQVTDAKGKGAEATDAAPATTAILTGVVRGRGLKADRLVQVGDWGTFQIDKITAAPLHVAAPKRQKAASTTADAAMALDDAEQAQKQPTADGVVVLESPTEDRDDLADLAPEDAVLSGGGNDDGAMEDDDDDENNNGNQRRSFMMDNRKGVLLDDHHYFSEEEDEASRPARRLPKGTSAYQSAWILDDATSESGSDLDEDETDGDDVAMGGSSERRAQPADGMEGLAPYAATEVGGGAGGATTVAGSEYPGSEYEEQDDETEAAQLAQYRAQKRSEEEDDREFPDEIELQPHVLARERLARYRGLKSLRSSPWNEDEDRPYEPGDWRRLLRIPDARASRIRACREALVGGVAPGTRVAVHIRGDTPLPESVLRAAAAAASSGAAFPPPGSPLTLFSLLRHENKQTVVNILLNLSADHPRSIKAKEEIVVSCGPRRFVVRPLFSQEGVTPNNVHKYHRYVHPGQTAVATFVAPVTWGAVPTLFFQRASASSAGSNHVRRLPDAPRPAPNVRLAGTGTTLPPSTARVVAKRVVLTGHPYHIHKKIVTIRYMFFNREDVEWFKALPLWTKRGRSGFIKECLGTHGYFKATFDGRINPQDSVGVSLYKRVWPRKALLFRPGAAGDEPAAASAAAMDEDEEMA